MRKQIHPLLKGRPHLLAAILLLALLPVAFADNKPGVPPEKAMARLKAGNRRFVRGLHKRVDYVAERAALVKGQQPYAILLTCSDSRVPPELIFDESLGQLFIVRVAGNVTDPVTLGSIEYAAEHLGVHMLVVLGHEACGAVKATIEGGHLPPNVDVIAHDIEPAVGRAKARHLDPAATLKTAIAENVRQQMSDVLSESEGLREMVEKKSLTIVGGVYNLASGRVEWLSANAADAK